MDVFPGDKVMVQPLTSTNTPIKDWSCFRDVVGVDNNCILLAFPPGTFMKRGNFYEGPPGIMDAIDHYQAKYPEATYAWFRIHDIKQIKKYRSVNLQ